ncbi:dethiobiotin synthase [Rhodococcus sp. WMMA185]|uniref:dethiobiotin synthase n=1 Tax=Rhodococcus sp. WMMA185 TaxID=679318 RepID=UPI000877F164|nr:dethiobiotin synthase [Rhodococcus sp. WMMA185]AOW94698.1 dethiobiotin synthase [Rhodococcus sp. WMMA185]
MSIVLITGTSTDVGKTVATAALAAVARAAGLSVAVCKPAQTGVAPGQPGDLAEVRRLSGVAAVLELARYPDPLAPAAAARRAGLPMVRCADVVESVRALDAERDLVLVEGAGGLLVRLGVDGFTLVDLARALDAPTVVVAAAGLGTLNHTELTIRALTAERLACAGIVIGSWPHEPGLAEQCNLDDLPAVTGVDVVGSIPAGSGSLQAASFAAAAPGWFDSAWLSSMLDLARDSPRPEITPKLPVYR